MNKNSVIQHMINLIQENPELDIIPIVNSNMQGNKSQYPNYKYWAGKITDCELDEVMDTTPWECEPSLISRKYLHPFEKAELVSDIAEYKYGNREASTVNKVIDEEFDKMWKKVIFIYIDNPEEEEGEE